MEVAENSRWRLARVSGAMLPTEARVLSSTAQYVRFEGELSGWTTMSKAGFLSHYAPVEVVDDPEDGD